LLIVVVYLPSANAADKIRIGVPELNAQFIPLALAEKRGFFQEEGLQGEIIRINPTVALAALVSGELDYWTVIGNSVGAAIQGVPLRVAACYMPGPPARLSPALSLNPFRTLEAYDRTQHFRRRSGVHGKVDVQAFWL
jgi:ABC-type nitrate/sulfonate/bicarbonate transport system substrate-binding protein